MSRTVPLPKVHHITKYPEKKPEKESHRRADGLKSLLSQLQRHDSLSLLPQLHARIVKFPKHSKHPFLLTRLAHAYLLCNYLPPAERILAKAFPKSSPPPIFLWNETIKAHSRNGCFRESIYVYRRMLARGLCPNAFTFTFVLPACAGALSAPDGRRVHKDSVRFGFDSNLFVATALVHMYSKCGEIGAAREVFDGMPQRGTATFNAMIAGYMWNGKCEEAMSIFDQMQRLGVQYDAMTMVSILQACASLGTLQKGRWVHEQVIRAHMEINVHLGAALINMYARCGSIEESRRVFDEMPRRDLISWTAIICGYGMHGLADDAESLFNQMMESGFGPDSIAFVGLLSGFSHKGMVHKGQIYFKKMTEEYCIKPSLEHCSCMVDMLGRAGRLDEAEEFIRKMHLEPDPGVWGGLLNACKIHGNVDMGERVVEQVLRIDPYNAGWYVLMSNIYATARCWDGVAKMRLLMKERKVSKSPGWSSIEIGGQRHSFLAFDQSHPRSDEIYMLIKNLEERMHTEGYIAETKCVLVNLNEEVKEDMLCGHRERLATAFRILSTKEGEALRVIKNLRLCMDSYPRL
uniref:Pentatricopeptide repeat-containing protein At3g46790, chloroplastic isoform X2 n=1 Tax=Elaeis guineensis var. tenera TaxID=51953 RepID=A0A6I9QFQ8_ELAGV|nr:pentatricopeptide repeat-containing protein At3g46790, chloroplastic isoform X2 [Elaeis guineensis]